MQHYKKEYNPYTDAVEDWYWDADNETFTIRNRHNLGNILEMNKSQAAGSLESRFGGEMLHHVAEIPLCVVTKLKKEHNIDVFTSDPTEKRRLRRLLDDPEWRFLKTTVKRLWRPS